MGYRLFAGPLAMYYAGDYPSAPEQPPFDRDQLLAAVRQWQTAVASHVPGYRSWEEGNGLPYLTANLSMEMFGALVLKVCCHLTGEEMPASIPRGWLFYEDERVDRAMGSGAKVPSMLMAEVWVPSNETFMGPCTGPAGNEVNVSTTGTLRRDLAAINASIWRSGNEEIASWSESVPAIGDTMDAEALARFTFSVFCRILAAAESCGSPIIVGH